jgi:hypothetical protein
MPLTPNPATTQPQRGGSEAKHTAGPWKVDGPPDNQIVWSSPENRVCFLAHSNGADEARDVANARLIAAAPDLYEALEEAEEWLSGWASAEPYLAQIRAALALARAGQS